MLWENLNNQNGTIRWVCIYTCVYTHAYPHTGKIPFEAKLEHNSALLYYFLKWLLHTHTHTYTYILNKCFIYIYIYISNHYFQNRDTSSPKNSFSRNCTEAWVHLSDCLFLVLCLNLLTVAEAVVVFRSELSSLF